MKKTQSVAKAPQLMSKKIGIFAGTFDPVHNGHLAFAHSALDAGLEKVMFLPEPRPRRKQGVRALEHRTAMVQLATADEPRFSTIILEQARFTADETIPLLQARFKAYKLVLLFGDDVISHIANWPHVGALVRSTELMIASRDQKKDALEATFKILRETSNLNFTYQIVRPVHEHIASSKIKLNLKHAKPVEGLPEAVRRYINRQQLYSPAD